MGFTYKNFKVTNNNGKGFWVSLRELNYMLDKGIIIVDREKLEEYEATPVPELSILRMYDGYDSIDEMIEHPSDEGREICKKFVDAGKCVRDEIDRKH